MPRALIAEPSFPVAVALRQCLESLGFEVAVAHGMDEALDRVQERGLDLVFATSNPSFDGETLCTIVKELFPSLPVALVYPPEVENAQPKAEAAGADAWLVGPLERAAVSSCAKSLLRLKGLEERVAKLEADGAGMPALSGDFAFFKKLLLMEVKRSRRYRHPLSFLLVAVDGFKARVATLTSDQRKASLAEVLEVVTGCLRDIDLVMPTGDDPFLVFLPHTPREGAMVVAARLRDELPRLKSLPDATASVGVAVYEPGDSPAEVSFGNLMKDANEALRRAQEAGGDRVEASEKKARERISLG